MQTITHLQCKRVLSVYWCALIGTTFSTVIADAQCGGTPPCSSGPEEHHWYHRNAQPMYPSAAALLQTEWTDGTAPVLLCSEDTRATGTYLPPKSQRVRSYSSFPSSHLCWERGSGILFIKHRPGMGLFPIRTLGVGFHFIVYMYMYMWCVSTYMHAYIKYIHTNTLTH